jgi:hypothetical protein
MGRRLMGDDGQHHVFGPDDEVPAEFADKIGDHAWSSTDDERPAGTPPPQSGKGSGVDAWAAYAAEQGVAVPEDAKRDEIVQALSDAGHPVE